MEASTGERHRQIESFAACHARMQTKRTVMEGSRNSEARPPARRCADILGRPKMASPDCLCAMVRALWTRTLHDSVRRCSGLLSEFATPAPNSRNGFHAAASWKLSESLYPYKAQAQSSADARSSTSFEQPNVLLTGCGRASLSGLLPQFLTVTRMTWVTGALVDPPFKREISDTADVAEADRGSKSGYSGLGNWHVD